MREQHAGLAGRARVAVGGVRGDLLVARRDEPDPALAERVEERDVRVAAQAEDDLDAEPLEILGKQETMRSASRCRSLCSLLPCSYHSNGFPPTMAVFSGRSRQGLCACSLPVARV